MPATLTSKGQLTIPKEVRDRMGLNQGDRVEFCEKDGLMFIRKIIDAGDNPFLEQLGIAGPAGQITKRSAVERQRESRGWDGWDRREFSPIR